jgi:hypothetical protein
VIQDQNYEGEKRVASFPNSVSTLCVILLWARGVLSSWDWRFHIQKSSDIQEYIFLHHHPHHIILFLIILTMSVSSLGCLLKLLLCRWREDLADNLQHQQVLGSPLEQISCACTDLPSKDSSQPCSSIWTMDLLF